MKRNSTASMGAMHPVFFMLMVYVISVMLAFFVCTTVYHSLHGSANMTAKGFARTENFTALK